jgi:ribosomal-protein-alanine N-acetyltransferase
VTGESRAVVRRVSADDLEAIMIMEREAFGGAGWSTDGWRAELDGADRDVLVARTDGAVVGVITVQTVDVTADLHRLIIADSHRRQGIGTALIDAGVRAARERGAIRMLLEVEAGNDAGVAVYQHYGFEQLASRPDYYGPGRHALIMKLYELTGPVPITVDWVPDGATGTTDHVSDHGGRR